MIKPHTGRPILLILCFLLYLSTSAQYPLINENRTENINEFCTISRDEMIKKYTEEDLSFMEEQTKNAFSIDGMEFLVKIFKNQSIEDHLNENRGNIAIYFGFFAIPFIVVLVISPVLICFCACPDSCPLCQKCRQPPNRPYTSCEQTYPAVVSIILAIIAIAALIVSLVYKAPIQEAYSDTFCSVSITLDDLLNGNVSFEDNSKYWIGTVSAQNAIISMNGSFQSVSDTLETIGSSSTEISNLNTKLNSIITDLDNVPGSTPYEYPAPIDQSPTSTIPSTFPDVLGDTSSSNTLIFNTSITVEATKLAINTIGQLADATKAALDQFSTNIDEPISYLNTINAQINSANDVLTPANQQLDDSTTAVMIVFYIIVILGLIFAVLMIISALSILCCKKHSCRYLSYISCSALSFFALIYFALAILFSIATPISYYSCFYLETGLKNPDNFIEYFGPIIGYNASEIFSPCTTQGDGVILDTLYGNQTTLYIESISDLVGEIQGFTGQTFKNAMTNQANVLITTTENYKRAKIQDFDDPYALIALETIANSTQFACQSSNFEDDSWIPSVSQNPGYVQCTIIDGKLTTHDQCPSGIQSSTNDCNGCMDTYDLLVQPYTTVSNVADDLALRYPNATCSDFITTLSNVWENFYKVKKSVIGGAQTRATNVLTKISQMDLATIQTNFVSASASLLSNLDTVVDPSTGLLAGLNCKVISQDVILTVRTICNSTFAYAFFQRIVFAVAGWALMILACFSVCLGIHSFRASKIPREQMYVDQVNSSAQIYSQQAI